MTSLLHIEQSDLLRLRELLEVKRTCRANTDVVDTRDLVSQHDIHLDTFKPRHILMIVADPGVHPVRTYPMGFWAPEFAHPWYEFTEAGFP
jgi:hypothetical protein